jgi:hypothetical protein
VQPAAEAGAQSAASAAQRTRKAKATAGARARPQGAAGARARRPASSRASRSQDRAPRQGFESEGESTTGPVMPPGASELLGAASELLADVAKASLSRGASTLKDIVGRLRLP